MSVILEPRRSRRHLVTIVLVNGWLGVSSLPLPVWAQSSVPGANVPSLDEPGELVLDENGIPHGWSIIEGDIVVPEAVHESRAAYATNLWQGGIVPFQFDPNVTAANQAIALDMMAEWEAVADVDFQTRSGQADFVRIRDSSNDPSPANNSPIGNAPSIGEQIINFTSWNSPFRLVHELGHCLGYWHEQSRLDRSTAVVIEEANISQTRCGGPCDHNFDPRTPPGGEYGPYDFDSLMHYGQCDFSCCGDSQNPCGSGCANATCRTITTIDPALQAVIGQRTHLSFWDGKVMSFLYPENDWRFVDTTDLTSLDYGTFLEPYRTVDTALDDLLLTGGGRLIILQPTTFDGPLLYATPMVIEAPLGGVTLK